MISLKSMLLEADQKPLSDQKISNDLARKVGDKIGVDWKKIRLDQFRRGMEVELEHGTVDPQTDVTHDDPILTGKIALAHLKELPDYYTRLNKMENEDVEPDEVRTAEKTGMAPYPNDPNNEKDPVRRPSWMSAQI